MPDKNYRNRERWKQIERTPEVTGECLFFFLLVILEVVLSCLVIPLLT